MAANLPLPMFIPPTETGGSASMWSSTPAGTPGSSLTNMIMATSVSMPAEAFTISGDYTSSALPAATDPEAPRTIRLLGAQGALCDVCKFWKNEVKPNLEKNCAIQTDVILAIVEACRKCCNRRRQVVCFILEDMIAVQLPDEAVEEILFACCEMGERDIAYRIFQKFIGVKKSKCFYYSLIRLATEILAAVDMGFAVEVCDEMVKHGVNHNVHTLHTLFYGCSRTNPVSFDVAVKLLEYRRNALKGVPVERELINDFCNVADATVGNQAFVANQYIAGNLSPEFLMVPLRDSMPKVPPPPIMACQGGVCGKVVYVVDPWTFPMSEVRENANDANAFIMTYSSVRALANVCFLTDPEAQQRVADTEAALVDGIVRTVPYGCEVVVRGKIQQTVARPSSADLMYSFVLGVMLNHWGPDMCMIVLSRDPNLIGRPRVPPAVPVLDHVPDSAAARQIVANFSAGFAPPGSMPPA